jgi:hypothetical protein
VSSQNSQTLAAGVCSIVKANPAVFNRWIRPYVMFLPLLQAILLVGEGHYTNRGDSGYKPLLRHRSTALQSGIQKSLHM